MTVTPVRAIETFEVDVAGALRFEPHTHPTHELLWGARGTVVVEAGPLSWLLAPALGLWVPAGTRHGGLATAGSSYRGANFSPVSCPIRWTTPTVVPVGRLLAEMLDHLHHRPLAPRSRWHAEQVVMDLLTPLSSTAELPTPTDDRLRAVTSGLLGEPADDRTLEEWGREVGASARTLTRLFLSETGTSFTRWRAQARVQAALPHLARGATTTQVARLVGYATTSAFVRAFKQVTGSPPRAYVAVQPGVERRAVDGWEPPERIQLDAG